MVKKKVKKAVRKAAVKKPAVKKKTSRKAAPRKKKATAFKRIENAIEMGMAELDDVAMSMGLLGAVEPAPKKPKKKKR